MAEEKWLHGFSAQGSVSLLIRNIASVRYVKDKDSGRPLTAVCMVNGVEYVLQMPYTDALAQLDIVPEQ